MNGYRIYLWCLVAFLIVTGCLAFHIGHPFMGVFIIVSPFIAFPELFRKGK